MTGTAAGGAASAHDGGVRYAAGLELITVGMLRATFPEWRIFGDSGSWWAVRGGLVRLEGPQSLLRRVITACDLTALAERLCLQEYLDRLSPEELAAVYRDMALPEAIR